jgi:tetratricopeptide (TPR) repeat protein
MVHVRDDGDIANTQTQKDSFLNIVYYHFTMAGVNSLRGGCLLAAKYPRFPHGSARFAFRKLIELRVIGGDAEMKAKRFSLFLGFLTLGVLLLQAAAVAQTGSGKTPETSSDNGKSAKWNNLSRQGHSGDYLTGNVIVTGGVLPWDPIPITVTCDGKIRSTADADPKGNFEIAATAATPTLGVEGAKTKPVSEFFGCTVTAVLPGFDSSILTIANRNILDSADIGTIKLTREEGAAGAAVSPTTASAPKEATKAFEKARSEWQDQKPDRAQHDLEKAVQIYPQFAEAWYQLGKLQQVLSPNDAGSSFAKAVAADPKFVPPYEHLVPLAAVAGKWQEVADDTARELELNPRGTAQIWYYHALANYKLNKKDVAEASATKALAMDPLHTQSNTEQLLAVILADKQDYAGALAHLRNCLTYLPSGQNADVVKQQVAQLEKIVPGSK